MIKINIPIEENPYEVIISRGILNEIDTYIDINRQIVIITDDFIPKVYLNTIKEKMLNPLVFEVPQGESSKSMEIAYSIIDEMVDSKITRKCLIIALGGGVVGDLAGFISSIYMRGVDFIQIPTTLLSQIDSSIGGKVGINSSNMKNSIGSFYQPKVVLIDPNTLKTLAQKEIHNGIGEMIKYGLIAGKALFIDVCEKNIFLNIEDYIEKCIKIKKNLIVKDVFDNGERQLLNFGHTIGHAIEQFSRYNILHGEAVSIGMAKMAIDKPYYTKLIEVLDKYSLPYDYEYDVETLYNFIKTDKKASENTINLVLVDEVGKGYIKNISINKIKEYL